MSTGSGVLQITEAHLPEHRERLYPPMVTLSMFLPQALATASRQAARWHRVLDAGYGPVPGAPLEAATSAWRCTITSCGDASRALGCAG